MINSNLPRGLKYKIDKVRPGIIVPGTDSEPIITISGRGATIQYRLVTYALGKYALIDDTYCEGDLDQDELDGIDTWISHSMPSLLSESKIRHLIYFLPNSKCYYDFLFQKLYGGDGYKEKKKQRVECRENTVPIDGNPCSLSVSEIAFIDILTEHPNTPFSADRFFGEDAESTKLTTAKSLDQTWYRFRQYDTSINKTFKRERGSFIYRGDPQIWRVDAENEIVNLSIEKIFKVVCTRDVVATFNEGSRQFHAVAVPDISPRELLIFLGLNSNLFDPALMSIDWFVVDNYCDSAEVLKQLFERYYYTLDAVWIELKKILVENYTCSLRAASFFGDTGTMPTRIVDLKGYSVSRERLDNSMRRICPAIEETIKKTKIAASYFSYCITEVTPENAVDYIVALILICISDCHTISTDEELVKWKGRYQQKLRTFIQQKFNFAPPGDGKDSIFEEIRRRLFDIEEQMLADGFESYVLQISEVRNLFILGYNDENSLLPPSMSREL